MTHGSEWDMEICPKVRTQKKKFATAHRPLQMFAHRFFNMSKSNLIVRSWSGIFGHVAGLYHRHSRASSSQRSTCLSVCLSQQPPGPYIELQQCQIANLDWRQAVSRATPFCQRLRADDDDGENRDLIQNTERQLNHL